MLLHEIRKAKSQPHSRTFFPQECAGAELLDDLARVALTSGLPASRAIAAVPDSR
jgi:hypothetical protein